MTTLRELVERWYYDGATREEVVGWVRRGCKDMVLLGGDENVHPDEAGRIYDELQLQDAYGPNATAAPQ